MYLGPFYFNTKEIFLIIASILLGIAMYMGWQIWWFDPKTLLTLTILILITKGLLPAIHNESFFVLALVTIFLSFVLKYFSISAILLYKLFIVQSPQDYINCSCVLKNKYLQ